MGSFPPRMELVRGVTSSRAMGKNLVLTLVLAGVAHAAAPPLMPMPRRSFCISWESGLLVGLLVVPLNHALPYFVMNSNPAASGSLGSLRLAMTSRIAWTVSGHREQRRSTPVFGLG